MNSKSMFIILKTDYQKFEGKNLKNLSHYRSDTDVNRVFQSLHEVSALDINRMVLNAYSPFNPTFDIKFAVPLIQHLTLGLQSL